MSKMFHIFYMNYLLSNTSWHTADIPENSEIELFGQKLWSAKQMKSVPTTHQVDFDREQNRNQLPSE